MIRAWGAITVAGLTTWAGAAMAQSSSGPKGTWVVVAVGSCEDPALGLAAARFRQALSAAVGPGVLGSDSADDRFGVHPTRTLDQLSRRVATMQSRYLSTDFEGALAVAVAIDASFQQVLPSPQESADKLAFSLLTVEALIHAEHAALAQAQLERLAEIEPAAQLDPLKYPPSVEKRWSIAKTHLATGERTTLDIPGPAGAHVYLDGLSVGPAPVELRVRPGEAFDLQLESGGLVSRHYTITPTNAAFTEALDLAMESRFRAEPDMCFDSQGLTRDTAIRSMMRTLDVGGSGHLGPEGSMIDDVVLVWLDDRHLLGAALWSRSIGDILRRASLPAGQQSTTPEAVAGLARYIATGEPMGRAVPSSSP